MAGRGQTTKGIWLSKSPKVTETSVLVMDLEGSDGRERGEDDTNFERQSALFALAVADVLLVNIWCHDIGREHGSGKPLLKTIFQVRTVHRPWDGLKANSSRHGVRGYTYTRVERCEGQGVGPSAQAPACPPSRTVHLQPYRPLPS